ncbi:MAG: 4-hydroxy-tetrahydrodipicolinate synthase [Bdellovibrionales bacterium]
MNPNFSGVYTALVTPFDKNFRVDFKSLETLVKQQLQAGVQGFVINGTTAESPTLEISEVKEIWQSVRGWSRPETKLILGTGSNCTRKTIEMTQKAVDWKADAALVVVPYYNKPPQRGLFQHFKKVADEAGAPILLYNVPGRTITSLSVETAVELSHVPHIIGIKDATGDMEIARALKAKTRPGFQLLSGDDGTYAAFLKEGGHGIISVGSHVVPDLFLKVTELSGKKNDQAAQALQDEFKNLIDSLYIEANPIPVKKALQLMGLLKGAGLRLPLLEAQTATEEKLKAELRKKGLLK